MSVVVEWFFVWCEFRLVGESGIKGRGGVRISPLAWSDEYCLNRK